MIWRNVSGLLETAAQLKAPLRNVKQSSKQRDEGILNRFCASSLFLQSKVCSYPSINDYKDYLCCIRIYLAVGLGANLAVVTRPAFLPAMIMLSSATFQGRQELAMWCFWHVLASRATVMVQLSGLGNPNQCPETQWFLGQNNEFEHFHTPMSVPHCHIVYILLDTLDMHIFLIPPARAERCEFTAGAMERESLVFLGIHFIHFIIPSSYLHPCLSTYPQPLHPFQWFWSQ